MGRRQTGREGRYHRRRHLRYLDGRLRDLRQPVHSRADREREFYGIKVRQGVRCRVHHNTIKTNFSMEFPFENDETKRVGRNV